MPKSPAKTPAETSIPFNRPPLLGKEMAYLQEALEGRHYAGDGSFTKRCTKWLQEQTKAGKVLLTHSCTAALEMAAILSDLKPGDEVIMPSFTFVSTANAVVLRGAIPVFIDIRPDTLNIDEKLIAAAITPRTKGISIVHYAGVGCAMDEIMAIANAHNIPVTEDAAQGLMATYKGRPLGSIGHFAGVSFHETKNIVAGEGGALYINDAKFNDRAEIIREKGTNRMQFFRGMVDKYTWVDLGSSYLPSEFNAAVLLAQLENAQAITDERKTIWQKYHQAFASLEGRLTRPSIPKECEHNGHLYYLLTKNLDERTRLMAYLKTKQINAPFHYVPLHSAPAGKTFGRTHGSLAQTDALSDRLIRLPLYIGLDEQLSNRVIETVHEFYKRS